MSSHVESIEVLVRQRGFFAAAQKLSAIDNIAAGLALLRQWAIIVASFAAAIWADSPVFYLLAIVVIATRQHALGVLLHDAAHYRLFSNRWMNDFFANLLCAGPAGLVLSRYRDDHLKHHIAPHGSADPHWQIYQDYPFHWQWPKTKLRGVIVLILDIVGINSPATIFQFSRWFPWRNHFSRLPMPVFITSTERILTYIAVIALIALLTLTRAGWYFVVLWVVPLVTVMPLLLRIRTLAEHFALPEQSGTEATRDVEGNWIERLSICPLGVGYHLTHHLFPSIPHYNVRSMHLLLAADIVLQKRAHFRKSYFGKGGVWEELVTNLNHVHRDQKGELYAELPDTSAV